MLVQKLLSGKRIDAYRAALALAIPLIGSNIAHSVKHLTDTIMLGRYSVDALAAGVLGATIFVFLMITGSGFSVAVISLASNAEGSHKSWMVRRYIRMGCWITILYCLVMLIPMWFSQSIFLLMGQDPAISELAADYLLYAMWGLFPALILMVFKAFFLALVRPKIIFVSTLLGALFNIFANYLLIFGNFGFPELGVRGAAIASTVSHSLALLIMLAFLIRVRDFLPYKLFSNFLSFHSSSFREIFNLGWPICAAMIAEASFFSGAAIMMGWINTASLAAHGIVIEICAMVFMIYYGLSYAGTTQISSALGRNDPVEIKTIANAILELNLMAACVVITIFLLFPETLISVFLKEDTPETRDVLGIGMKILLFAAFFQLFDAFQAVLLGFLRGLKDTLIPMIIAAISYWVVGIPTSYFLAFNVGLEGEGVYGGFIIGLGFASILFYFRFRRKLPKLGSGDGSFLV